MESKVTPDFDVIVIGSGPAGVSSAFPLVEAGLRVLMIDGGKKPDQQSPESDFLSVRANDPDQWKWMVGENFHSLKMRGAVSPKLRVPVHAFAFDGFGQNNQIDSENFIAVGSLATGGLSNAWGCGVARYSAKELAKFPFPISNLDDSYSRVCQRIGISGGCDDDMSDYFGLDEYSQPPIPMDALHEHLFQKYIKQRERLISLGIKIGRSRVAALSQDISSRQACALSGNCLWGCRRHSLYSSVDDLTVLRAQKSFSELSGFLVDGIVRADGRWGVQGTKTLNNERRQITANRIILAAGTLATTRIALNALNYRAPVSLLSCPTSAFLLWLPRLLGISRMPGFGLGQLSFALKVRDEITAFGSTFSMTGILVSEFLRHVPMRRRYGIDVLRELLSSCVVGNLFLPGHLTIAQAKLKENGSLFISGSYDDDVIPLMGEASKKLRRAYWSLGAILVPGSYKIGLPGSDIHYAGTLPMRKQPVIGETSRTGELFGMEGVYVVDGACLPSLPEKSHTLTVMANADRIGRLIAQLNISKK